MITKPNFYKNEIYLPNAKSDISDDVLTIESELTDFIIEYEEECLITCLGYLLAKEFMSNLDSTQTDGLIVGADAKWGFLLNGKEYTNSDGNVVNWKGLRFASVSGGVIDRSLLAYYVYYYYESNSYITRSSVGNQIPLAKNAETITPTQKVTKAWRKFSEMAQGGFFVHSLNGRVSPDYITNQEGSVIGVDYMGSNVKNRGISLYKFIDDTNKAEGITYYNKFDPTEHILNETNQFGI